MLKSLSRWGALAATLLALLPAVAFAQEGGTAPAPRGTEITAPAPAPAPAPTQAASEEKAWAPDKGDTAWLLMSAALVLLMTPGLALFYGGMVRRKNVLGTLMQSFIAMGLITILWVIVGYSLGFSEGGPLIGSFKYLLLNGVGHNDPSPYFINQSVGPEGAKVGTIPHMLYMAFQMMFAIITPALISGAFAERMKFSAYLWFIGLWSLLIYAPIAHWVWGADGWLYKMGALDFAGGTVVHISSGVTALVCALMMGKRKNYPSEEMRPHNLTMTLIGTGLLWFGWFGFNGGSSLAADGLGVVAFTNTHVAAGTAMLVWILIEWGHRQKPTALGAASGAVAGLVGITPAAGFVNVAGALLIGAAVAAVCYAAVMYKSKLGYDDSLDTFGVHGVGGTVGAVLTGVLAVKAVSGLGDDGLLFGGGTTQLVKQLAGVGATWAYAAIGSVILLLAIDKTIGLRMKSTDEEIGMDVALHGEEGYVL